MKYEIIFTSGYEDDLESLTKELKCDVLILDDKGDYYAPQFITLDRIYGEFREDRHCYLEENLVILREVTKDSILKSIPEIHKWQYYLRWLPLPKEQLIKYFPPKERWVIFTVVVP